MEQKLKKNHLSERLQSLEQRLHVLEIAGLASEARIKRLERRIQQAGILAPP